MTPKPLTPKQHLATQMLGEGRTQEEAAEAASTTTTSIRRWGKREDFAALVKEHRERRLDANPSARAVLEEALTATSKKGFPIWPVRIAAAKALLLDDEQGPKTGRVVERIYVGPDE